MDGEFRRFRQVKKTFGIIFLSSAGNCPLGDSGDGGDGSFGMPPADCRNCHPYPLHDGHDDGDGVFGILPRKSCNRHAAVLLSEAARRRIAGRKTCHKGVQRERLAHGSLQGKV